jgi:hypothetical protein
MTMGQNSLCNFGSYDGGWSSYVTLLFDTSTTPSTHFPPIMQVNLECLLCRWLYSNWIKEYTIRPLYRYISVFVRRWLTLLWFAYNRRWLTLLWFAYNRRYVNRAKFSNPYKRGTKPVQPTEVFMHACQSIGFPHNSKLINVQHIHARTDSIVNKDKQTTIHS